VPPAREQGVNATLITRKTTAFIDDGIMRVMSREVVAVNVLSTSIVSLSAREKVVIHTLHRRW
jgi:hypothetical protein